MQHEMKYRAGTSGLGFAGIVDSDPYWYCQCGSWRMKARPNATRASGNNKIEAEKSWLAHEVRCIGGSDTGGN